MRLTAIFASALLAACTTGAIDVPGNPPVITEVPAYGSAPAYGTVPSSSGGDFTQSVEAALAEDTGTGFTARPGAPLDADTLNLTLYTIEQQKIDAAAAERALAAARSQLVVVQPGSVPSRQDGVNIALFAQQSTNAVGERVYARSPVARLRSGCGRFESADSAQRSFLAEGGPVSDSLNLDADGDGFACAWDPGPYRALRS